jgi:acetylornithine/succinyldiaminopimelate/putrescine aminotransferase
VGLAAFDEISRPETLENVLRVAGYLGQQLQGLKDRFPDVVSDIRGKGMLIGVQADPQQPRDHGAGPRPRPAYRRRRGQLRPPLPPLT